MATKINDFASLIESFNKSLDDIHAPQFKKGKKEDVPGITEQLFRDSELLNDLADMREKSEYKLTQSSREVQENIRQAIAVLASNIDKVKLTDRSNEGKATLKSEIKKIQSGIFLARYEERAKAEKTFVNRDGKVQPLTMKDGSIKFGTWPLTKRGWNVIAQFTYDVDKFGWNNVVVNGKVVPYTETQKWTLGEDDEVIKTPESPDNVPMTNAEKLKAAVNRVIGLVKKIPITEGEGKELVEYLQLSLTQETGRQLLEKAEKKNGSK
jgi:hypothetical protein